MSLSAKEAQSLHIFGSLDFVFRTDNCQGPSAAHVSVKQNVYWRMKTHEHGCYNTRHTLAHLHTPPPPAPVLCLLTRCNLLAGPLLSFSPKRIRTVGFCVAQVVFAKSQNHSLNPHWTLLSASPQPQLWASNFHTLIPPTTTTTNFNWHCLL